MGLLYTMHHLDFDESEWKQVSNDPIIFESLNDNVSLEINDTTQREYKLRFRKGGKIKMIRVVGKFRLNWDDSDLLN